MPTVLTACGQVWQPNISIQYSPFPVLSSLQLSVFICRGEIPAVEITDLDGDSGTRPQRYGDGDLVINREYFLVPTDKGISVFPRPPAGAEICAKIFISMVGVSVSDHNRCLFEYVPPSHRRLLEKGSIVRLGTEIMLEVVTIRELNGSEKEEVESSFSTCGGK